MTTAQRKNGRNQSWKGSRLGTDALKDVIETVESEYDLPKGTILPETVRTRFKQNNDAAPNIQLLKTNVEPTLVDYCTLLAQMGSPLTKEQVELLANNLIKGIETEERM